MNKRINITLPEETIRVLDKVAKKGERSGLVSKAILYFVRHYGESVVKEQMKRGYEANAKRDVQIAEEWFPLEEEAWEIYLKSHKKKH